MTDKRWEK